MSRKVLEKRVDRLEEALIRLSEEVTRLSVEMREFKEEMREFKEEMREFKEDVEKFKEWSMKNIEELREMSRDFKKRWGELSNKLGTIVEDIVAPALPEVLRKYFSCDLDAMMVRVLKRHQGDPSKIREFDVIILCNGKVVLNETKATPRMEYVERFVEFIGSGEFFEYFPEYSGRELMPIFSSLNLSESVVKYLSRKGVYAMALKGDYMDILNFEDVSKSR